VKEVWRQGANSLAIQEEGGDSFWVTQIWFREGRRQGNKVEQHGETWHEFVTE